MVSPSPESPFFPERNLLLGGNKKNLWRMYEFTPIKSINVLTVKLVIDKGI